MLQPYQKARLYAIERQIRIDPSHAVTTVHLQLFGRGYREPFSNHVQFFGDSILQRVTDDR